MESAQRGRLLIASPRLIDPNFYKSVVFVVQHDTEGAIGVVLNRPTDQSVSEHLPAWSGAIAHPGFIRVGGPVEPDVAVGLAKGPWGDETGLEGIKLIDLGSEPREEVESIVVFAGYAGWGRGQLEEELLEGSWYPVEAEVEDIYDTDNGLWSRILKRQPGHLSLLSTYPADTSLN